MKLLLHACCGPCSLEPTRLLREAGHDLTIFYANSNIHPASEYQHRLDTLRTWANSEGVPVIEGTYDPQAWEETAGRIGDAALEEAEARLEREAWEHTGADSAGAGNSAARDDAKDGDTAAGGRQSMAHAGDIESDEDAAAAGTNTAAGDKMAESPLALPGELPPCLAVDPEKRQARCRACYRLRLEETARAAAEMGFEGISSTLTVSPYQYTEIIHEELARAAGQTGLQEVFYDFRPYYPEATRRSRELGMYRQNFCGCRISNDEAAAEREQRKAQRKAQQEAERAAHAEERAAEEAAREARKAERAAYDAKQARKHAILRALREQGKQEEAAGAAKETGAASSEN